LTGKHDLRDKEHDQSPTKSKIKRKITIRNRIKSTIKIKSRISCTDLTNAGSIMRERGEFRPSLSHALALNPLPNLTLHLTLSLICEPLINALVYD